MQKFLIFTLLILSGCHQAQIKHGAINFNKDGNVAIGQSKKDFLEKNKQESFSLNNDCLYYIDMVGTSFYFLPPSKLKYTINKVCFKDDQLSSFDKKVEDVNFKSYDFKEIKNKEKLSIKKQFKKALDSASVAPIMK